MHYHFRREAEISRRRTLASEVAGTSNAADMLPPAAQLAAGLLGLGAAPTCTQQNRYHLRKSHNHCRTEIDISRRRTLASEAAGTSADTLPPADQLATGSLGLERSSRLNAHRTVRQTSTNPMHTTVVVSEVGEASAAADTLPPGRHAAAS